MGAADLQALLRFLSQEAKVPLAMAMAKVKELQAADLDSPDRLSQKKTKDIVSIFPDEKMAKQVITAARRVSKKRSAEGDIVPSPKKKQKDMTGSTPLERPEELENSISLPNSIATEDELRETNIFTNRAPLVLAFAVTLLNYTMPEQPLSSRLSLAQGYVSTTSRARAVSLGIQDISKDEELQEASLGEGQPIVTIMGKELRVLKRWGYEWKSNVSETVNVKHEGEGKVNDAAQVQEEKDHDPALWALDLEALRKGNSRDPVSGNSGLPIYTPQSARAYLLKSFDSATPLAEDGGSAKKQSAKAKSAEKEENLGRLLKAVDLVYASWAETLSPEELDKRTWSWYVRVRPSVESGVAGWGGKNQVKLADILDLRRET
ncbi:hypothetical protein KC367_g6568 [Hortaea werneckii]|uniref:Impact N-terminal domain-containing protein n=2 Tax=Hortaea werneckii TaxID=91943 RepID=A0A3M7IT55_HORWE|nr:hypothetical protein KC358_g9707 [Hortaea werneckii]OTA38156.1 hypothetical protein BTJ68_01973 [Hortaea werneckii EXF-2000]KAI6824826.1 hypothetical protein KC350_g8911 [Hortaea werneckii]KAI6922286.1 hypothetical protein KC348_g9838 [Hortaea werneckii]KAI6931843.1 hypothetical protein KC341_g9369 [Hortaea werneckii]